MDDQAKRECAAEPDDLGRFILERLNAGDVDGLVELYEPDAMLVLPDGRVAAGHGEIRRAYERLLAARPAFAAGEQRPTLRNGDLAVTSTRLPGGTLTLEVARRQPDGTWRWAIDHPDFPC